MHRGWYGRSCEATVSWDAHNTVTREAACSEEAPGWTPQRNTYVVGTRQGHVWEQMDPLWSTASPVHANQQQDPPSLGKCVALVGDVAVGLHGTGLCEMYEPFHG